MSLDPNAYVATLSAIHHGMVGELPKVDRCLNLAAPSTVGEGRRLADLGEAYGDLCAAISHGHADLDTELYRIGGAVTAWLLQREQERDVNGWVP
jgi:hypothetical protein